MLTIRKERRTAMRHLVNKCSQRIICRLPQKREEGDTKFLLCHPLLNPAFSMPGRQQVTSPPRKPPSSWPRLHL